MSLARIALAFFSIRWLVRAPVWLYRARLGVLLGPRIIMLEHIGRKSKARRYVILEVVARGPGGVRMVASGFGERSQWFRNIRVDPGVRVYALSRRPVPATARILPADEAKAILDGYADRYPRMWRKWEPVLRATLGAPEGELSALMPMVALEPVPPSTQA